MTNQNAARILRAIVARNPQDEALFQDYEAALSESGAMLELPDNFGDYALEILSADPKKRALIGEYAEYLQKAQSFSGEDGKKKRASAIAITVALIVLLRLNVNFKYEQTQEVYAPKAVAAEICKPEQSAEGYTLERTKSEFEIGLTPINNETFQTIVKTLSPALNVLIKSFGQADKDETAVEAEAGNEAQAN